MLNHIFRRHAESLLAESGICINGARPFDIQIRDERFYRRVFTEKSLGLGESYMDGWWDCDNLAQFFARVFDTHPDIAYGGLRGVALRLGMKIFNLQSVTLSRRVAERHYNLGNDLYEAMLGKTMAYTCGYWKSAQALDQAQRNKYALICRKLDLKKGQHILELGCGWGGFARFAAEECGVRVTAINIADEQLKYAREKCVGLPVEFLNCDWHEIAKMPATRGPYDHVVSIGMLEHVGPKNFRTFTKTVASVMKEDALFLLHSIIYRGLADPWINAYIFPGGIIPSTKQVIASAKGVFSLEDAHNFAPDYARTLHAWYENFERAWPALRAAGKYDERFRRMWRYYLLSCAGSFTTRQRLQLYQFVLSKSGLPGFYTPVR